MSGKNLKRLSKPNTLSVSIVVDIGNRYNKKGTLSLKNIVITV